MTDIKGNAILLIDVETDMVEMKNHRSQIINKQSVRSHPTAMAGRRS